MLLFVISASDIRFYLISTIKKKTFKSIQDTANQWRDCCVAFEIEILERKLVQDDFMSISLRSIDYNKKKIFYPLIEMLVSASHKQNKSMEMGGLWVFVDFEWLSNSFIIIT